MEPTLVFPEVTTARLTLRAPALNDFADSYAMWSDPDTARFIGGRPATEEEAWARLNRYVGHWALLGYGFFTVREKATGLFVGEVGLAQFKRDISPAWGEVPETGWALASAMRGRGYATEAVLGAIAWAERTLALKRTVCIISPENTTSIRVALRAGFKELHPATYRGSVCTVFERESVHG